MALICFAILLGLSRSQAEPSLPTPTGIYSVGHEAVTVNGESVLLWYPARKSTCAGTYVSPASAETLSAAGKYYDQSPEHIRSWATIRTASCEAAPVAPGRLPLVVLLPGAGVYAVNYTLFAQELASRGFEVAGIDYFSPQAPKRSYSEDDSAAMESDMARVASRTIDFFTSDKRWAAHVDSRKIYAVGHSIGGSATIAAARADHRILAAVNMDGGFFGESLQGTQAPTLILRSKPIYSDADLARRGRTREDFEKLGEQIRKDFEDFRARSRGTFVAVLSVSGTGHFSFSDAPFVMPDTITRFGGKIIAPNRGYTVITTCLGEFLSAIKTRSDHPTLPACTAFPEIAAQK